MRTIRTLAAALLLLATGAGCTAALAWTPTNAPPRELRPRPPSEVALLDMVPRDPFVEVGVLEAHQEDGWSDLSDHDLLKAVRKEVARRGCDAGIFAQADKSAMEPTIAGAVLFGANGETGSAIYPTIAPVTLRGFRTSCIVFLPKERPAVRPASAEQIQRVSALPEAAD